jgi:hypothetical protein
MFKFQASQFAALRKKQMAAKLIEQLKGIRPVNAVGR